MKIASKAYINNRNKSIEIEDTEGNKYFFGFEILDNAINRNWDDKIIKEVLK